MKLCSVVTSFPAVTSFSCEVVACDVFSVTSYPVVAIFSRVVDCDVFSTLLGRCVFSCDVFGDIVPSCGVVSP